MDNNKLRRLLVAAIGVALVGMIVSKYATRWRWGSSDPGDVVPILVAHQYIPAFTVIQPAMVTVQEFPKALVPPGALRAFSELTNANEQRLFLSAMAIPERQPVTRAFLVDASQSDTLGSLIRPGKVAVSFEIDKAHGVGGWIRPGDTVAVFALTPTTVNPRLSHKKTRLLFPSVAVVAVDEKRLGQATQKLNAGQTDETSNPEAMVSPGVKIVTVLVGPLEASEIIEAREEGNLSVVLRSLGDNLPWPAVR